MVSSMRLLRISRLQHFVLARHRVMAALIADAERFVAGFRAAVGSAGLSGPVQIECDASSGGFSI
jgi:hypothetical protein